MTITQTSLKQAVLRCVFWAVAVVAAVPAVQARGDELPGRVGRVVQSDGRASLYDQEQNRWVDAQRNMALTGGDRLSTERGSNLQVAVGSTELRLAGDTEITFERLDDDRIVLVLQQGSLALRVRSNDVAREIEVAAGPARAFPARSGHYRFDRTNTVTQLTSWRGSLQVDTRDQRFVVEASRSAELFREWRDTTVVTWNPVVQDAFSDWVARDERRDDGLNSGERYVSAEMTGADELNRNGRWERHPDMGWVWLPLSVAVDWAPFRYGRWNWHARWGWTWLDDAPWGFATSHYGRWTSWAGRWVWVPGTYVARPVYAPALVGWVGGVSPGVSVSVGIGGGPSIGWFPLSPFDTYAPAFRHPPHYYDRVNLPHRRPGVPPQVPTGPISYGNNGVPNAVTVVPVQVMQQRQPVAPAVIRDPDSRRWTGGGQRPGQASPGLVPTGVPPVAGPPTPAPGGAVANPGTFGGTARTVPVPGGAAVVGGGVAAPLPVPPPVLVQPQRQVQTPDSPALRDNGFSTAPGFPRSAPQVPQMPQAPQTVTVAPQVVVPVQPTVQPTLRPPVQAPAPAAPAQPQVPYGRQVHVPAPPPVVAPPAVTVSPMSVPQVRAEPPMVRAPEPAREQRARVPEQVRRGEGRENMRERAERQ